ncbi:MAG: phosphoribosylanthranilate isomerase [Gemmataceae bacterium]
MSHVRVKICGVTTPADATIAADCGADAVGLNFYPKSPRFLTAEQAEAIVRELPAFTAAVGVFVDLPDDGIRGLAQRLGLRAVQTYSAEPPTNSFFPAAHIPAFRVKDTADLGSVRRFVATCRPAAVLIDSFVQGEMGGTGHRAPWHLLAGFAPGVPVILAGGLTPDNVADAIRLVRPWGVDVASGVESVPGRKDPGRVHAFVQAARSVTP